MDCIPSRMHTTCLFEASGQIFVNDFLQSDPFPTSKSGKADPRHNKSCLSFYSAVLDGERLPHAKQTYLPWSKVGFAHWGWPSIHFHQVFCY